MSLFSARTRQLGQDSEARLQQFLSQETKQEQITKQSEEADHEADREADHEADREASVSRSRSRSPSRSPSRSRSRSRCSRSGEADHDAERSRSLSWSRSDNTGPGYADAVEDQCLETWDPVEEDPYEAVADQVAEAVEPDQVAEAEVADQVAEAEVEVQKDGAEAEVEVKNDDAEAEVEVKNDDAETEATQVKEEFDENEELQKQEREFYAQQNVADYQSHDEPSESKPPCIIIPLQWHQVKYFAPGRFDIKTPPVPPPEGYKFKGYQYEKAKGSIAAWFQLETSAGASGGRRPRQAGGTWRPSKGKYKGISKGKGYDENAVSLFDSSSFQYHGSS
jgi:hypothetical protein